MIVGIILALIINFQFKDSTMKSTLIIISVVAVVFTTIFAQWNYQDALHAASLSEGSDGAISDSMYVYGFRGDIFEKVTTIEKIKALYYKR